MSETQLADQFLYQSSLKSDPVIKVSANKRVPYVIDINQGSYGQGIITIDGTAQLNGAEGFACMRDGYLMLPYLVSLKNTSTTASAAGVATRLCASLKCGNWNVIDQMSLELNGKQILSMQDFKMYWNNLRAQAECSPAYVHKHGAESFLFPDSSVSMLWKGQGTTASAIAGSLYGDGYINNITTANTVIGTTATGNGISARNNGFANRLISNPMAAGAATAWPTTGGNAATSNSITAQTGRGAFVAGAKEKDKILGSWYYMLKIKLTDLHPIFKELDLMANPQIRMRLRVNQGYSAIDVATDRTMRLSSTTLSSGNTCPVMLADANTGCPMAAVLGSGTISATQLTIAWGAVTNFLEPTINSTYFPFTTSRLYIPFVHLENPQALISKPVKKIRFNDVYAQWFYDKAGTGVSATQHNVAFDLQLSASIKNAKYVCLLPFAHPTNNFAVGTVSAQQFHSPFDSAPWTVQAGSSIRNFNVRIGSQNVFEVSHDYDFHSFSNEFSKLGSINGDLTPELCNGLIDYQAWSTTNRILVADVSRLTERDVPQAIQITGTNCACQGTNMLILVISERELTFDRLTGEVSDYT